MKKDYYIEFKADQFQIGKLMLTIGCNFDHMERFKPRPIESCLQKNYNTNVALSSKEDCLLLQAALEKESIEHTTHFYIRKGN